MNLSFLEMSSRLDYYQGQNHQEDKLLFPVIGLIKRPCHPSLYRLFL